MCTTSCSDREGRCHKLVGGISLRFLTFQSGKVLHGLYMRSWVGWYCGKEGILIRSLVLDIFKLVEVVVAEFSE